MLCWLVGENKISKSEPELPFADLLRHVAEWFARQDAPGEDLAAVPSVPRITRDIFPTRFKDTHLQHV